MKWRLRSSLSMNPNFIANLLLGLGTLFAWLKSQADDRDQGLHQKSNGVRSTQYIII
jgi:hypothetical protein